MSMLDALSEVFSDIILRSRIVLNGVIVFSRRLASPININDLVKELDENLYYLSIEVKNGESSTYHLYVYENEPIACIKEFSADIMGEKCLQELSQRLEGDSVKVKITAFKAPADVVEELRDKLGKGVKPATKVEKIEKPPIPSVPKEKPPVEKLEPTVEIKESRSASTPTSMTDETVKAVKKKPMARAEERAGVPLDVLSLLIREEISKLGYFVQDVSIRPMYEDLLMFITLYPEESIISHIDLSYAVVASVCSEYGCPRSIIVTIQHRKQYSIELRFDGNRRLCLALGVIPRILRDYGFALKNLNYNISGNSLEIEIEVKKLPYEVMQDYEKALKAVYNVAKGLWGGILRIVLKTGRFGRKLSYPY